MRTLVQPCRLPFTSACRLHWSSPDGQCGQQFAADDLHQPLRAGVWAGTAPITIDAEAVPTVGQSLDITEAMPPGHGRQWGVVNYIEWRLTGGTLCPVVRSG